MVNVNLDLSEKKAIHHSLADILASDKCRINIQRQINEVLSNQIKALRAAKAGARLKSNPATILDQKKMLDPVSFCNEYCLITAKQSSLPSRERVFISIIVNRSLIETINELNHSPK